MYINRYKSHKSAMKSKICGFFLVFTKPNQTESEDQQCTSTGGEISHMPAMKSKIRGFSSFYQTKPNLEGAALML